MKAREVQIAVTKVGGDRIKKSLADLVAETDKIIGNIQKMDPRRLFKYSRIGEIPDKRIVRLIQQYYLRPEDKFLIGDSSRFIVPEHYLLGGLPTQEDNPEHWVEGCVWYDLATGRLFVLRTHHSNLYSKLEFVPASEEIYPRLIVDTEDTHEPVGLIYADGIDFRRFITEGDNPNPLNPEPVVEKISFHDLLRKAQADD